jgi:predicted TIM-barrel fold metal-dependent hydrolase
MDLTALPIFDSQAHPFDHRRSGERGGDIADTSRDVHSFAREWSYSLDEPARGMIENTILVRRVFHDLAALLDCEDRPQTVAKVRDALYQSDPVAYLHRLFEDAVIETVLLDTGSPIPADEGYEVRLETMSSMLPCEVREIHRIEPMIRELLREAPPFDEFVARFVADIDAAVTERGAVALKSVIAYWTGLDIHIRDESEAKRAYAAMVARGAPLPTWLQSREAVPDERVMREFLFVQAMLRAGYHGIPIKVHTGAGPSIDMSTANPLLLQRVLNEPTLRGTALVLVHAGYPWVEGSGWLANQYDNVYIDLSTMIPLAGPGIATKIAAILEMAPATKVMYGSDCFGIPEQFWFSAREAKRSLGVVLDQLLDRGWITESEAWEIARDILHDNATRLFHAAAEAKGPDEVDHE